jgi:DUF177 domain-containing protein
MRIELASLENGKRSFAHTYSPGELVLEDERVSIVEPASISGEIRQKGERLRVTGKVSGRVQLECDRCLKPIEVVVDSRFDVEYVTAEDYQAQQALELTEADLNLSVFDGECLEIDELVKEELLLAVPDHVICKEDCKGMCAVCGVDKNSIDCACETREVDPRWSGLKELVNRN